MSEAQSEVQEVKKEDSSSSVQQAVPAMRSMPAPPWCVFKPGEMFPLKGYWFKFEGYTKGDFKLVFAGQGSTGSKKGK